METMAGLEGHRFTVYGTVIIIQPVKRDVRPDGKHNLHRLSEKEKVLDLEFGNSSKV